MNTEKAFSVDEAEESTGFLLWQVTNLWQREIRAALEEFGLTHSQFVLMASILWLTQQKQTITQVLLSSHTKIDPMTTSTVLRTLQKKGLLQRQEHATDTRAKTVALTEAGVASILPAIKAIEKFDHAFFTKLGPDVKGLNVNLLALLKKNTVTI